MAQPTNHKKLSTRYPTDLPSWQALKQHYREQRRSASLKELFANDSTRANTFSMQAGDLFLDYSKNLLTSESKKLLIELATETELPKAIEAMFCGLSINTTENRPALHVALRAKMSDQVALDVPGVGKVWQVLEQMRRFTDAVHVGQNCGHGSTRLTQIVNIGIGGSDLGVVMAARALKPYWLPGMCFHSVSNVDGTQLADLKSELDPAETLFVICSKTFTTEETMTNALVARQWIIDELGAGAVESHFVAASTNHKAMDAFGINPEFRFEFWDWVGGRFSLWSSIGLSIALMIGVENFEAMLAGGRRMDQHFRAAPFEVNMPVLMALIAIWYNNFFGAESQAVLPYDNRLDRFAAFLQQLQMESNGKSVRVDGKAVKTPSGMIIWGEPGSNAQHSFYQMLHQGTRLVPVDFILPVRTSGGTKEQQDLAIANCLAQSEALMDGYSVASAAADLQSSGLGKKEANELAKHKAHAGNRPSNTLLFERTTPEILGQLMALYEHKVFVEAAIWQINPFDQWGVELGKRLANSVSTAMAMDDANAADLPAIANASTDNLLKTAKSWCE